MHIAVGFTQLLRVASLQTLKTNIAVYDTHCIGLGEIHLSLSLSLSLGN